jgi:hypothetical protein
LPGKILPGEELDRMKWNINRGILVRSLGVEGLVSSTSDSLNLYENMFQHELKFQVFKLLCLNGTIKPEEEMTYARLYGNSILESGDHSKD